MVMRFAFWTFYGFLRFAFLMQDRFLLFAFCVFAFCVFDNCRVFAFCVWRFCVLRFWLFAFCVLRFAFFIAVYILHYLKNFFAVVMRFTWCHKTKLFYLCITKKLQKNNACRTFTFTFCVLYCKCVFTKCVFVRCVFATELLFTFCVFDAFCVFANAFCVWCVLRFCYVAVCVLRFCRFVTVAVFGFYQCVLRFVPEVRFLPLQCVLPGAVTPKKLCTFYTQVIHTKWITALCSPRPHCGSLS